MSEEHKGVDKDTCHMPAGKAILLCLSSCTKAVKHPESTHKAPVDWTSFELARYFEYHAIVNNLARQWRRCKCLISEKEVYRGHQTNKLQRTKQTPATTKVDSGPHIDHSAHEARGPKTVARPRAGAMAPFALMKYSPCKSASVEAHCKCREPHNQNAYGLQTHVKNGNTVSCMFSSSHLAPPSRPMCLYLQSIIHEPISRGDVHLTQCRSTQPNCYGTAYAWTCTCEYKQKIEFTQHSR